MLSRNHLNVKALQSCRFRYYLVVTAAMTISAFHHGFQMFVFNNPEKIIIEWLHNHTSTYYFSGGYTLYSTTVAIFSAGGVIGSSLTFLANARFGSVKIIIICGFLETIGFLLSFACGFLQSVVCLIFGRFLSGIAIGLADGVTVLFLVEISPTLIRGLILTAFELTIVNGIVGSQIGGLSILFGTRKKWLVMMFTSALGSITPVVIMWFSPESPRYILQKYEDEAEAKKSLAWFRKAEFVDKEFEELKEEASLNKQATNEPLACRLLLCLKVVTAEAASGYCILLYFSSTICEGANVKVLEPQYTTLVMGASLTFGTIVSLHLVDIVGRKKLLLISLQFTTCITVFLIFFFYAARGKASGEIPDFAGLVYFVVIMLLSVVYGLGIGSSRWTAMVEHFKYKIRPVAVSITLPANFFINFLIAQTFLTVENRYKPVLFIPCAVWGVCSFWVILSKVPDTKLRKEDLEKLNIYENVIT